jgi:hypothetical protein
VSTWPSRSAVGVSMPDVGAGHDRAEHHAPTEATVKELYATALRCGRPGCMQLLYRVSETGDRVLNSRVAHIHARREGGPRWDPALAEQDNRGYDNLILLCIEHSYEIDEIPGRYPPELLRDWKRIQVKAQEQAARKLPSLTDDEAADVGRLSFSMEDLPDAIRAALPFPTRTREEALDRAVRESAARRKTRLLAVPDDRQGAVVGWMAEHSDPVVEVPEGKVRVLVAPMGAGKSEQALRWWDEGLAEAQNDPTVEIPVWLDAREIQGNLDATVTARTGRDPDRPCRVVIDDLDGVPPGEAGRLLAQARLLTGMWPRTRVLATSRPGIIAGTDEVVPVHPWPAGRGADLVRLITGSPRWYPSAAETADLLTSPLTAIAVAARLLEGQDAAVSRLILLRDLAKTIIHQHPPDTITVGLWDEFARLARLILNTPGLVTAESFGNDAVVWQLTRTGLVVSDDAGLRFALPVFEQYFGANVLISGDVSMHEAAAPESFPRWRYAIAFALSAHPGHAEEWMLLLARTNPAVVSWTLNELTAGGTGTLPAVAAQGPAVSGPAEAADLALAEGRRLRETIQALLDGFGSCRTQLSRHHNGHLVQWGVQLFGGMLAISHARDTVPPPDLLALTTDTWEQPLGEWPRTTLINLPQGTLDRWFWARAELTAPLARLVQQRRLPVPAGSLLEAERQWVLAVRIMQIARKTHGTTIPVTALREAVDQLMEQVSRTVRSTWPKVGGIAVDSDDIRWIAAQLQHETREEICHPWPAPDRPGLWHRWRWQGYSPALAHQVVTDVLEAAVIGYRDLVAENFAAFGWALGLNSALPVEIRGRLVVREDDSDGSESRLQYQLHPASTAHPGPIAEINIYLVTAAAADRYGARVEARPYDRKRIPFYVPTDHTIEPPTRLARAATNLAYQWLAADLHALGWLPQGVMFHD